MRAKGEASGLFGAKITGGGSGGVVCVLGEATDAAAAAVRRVAAKFEEAVGRKPYVVAGSSMGAVQLGHVVAVPAVGTKIERSVIPLCRVPSEQLPRYPGGPADGTNLPTRAHFMPEMPE